MRSVRILPSSGLSPRSDETASRSCSISSQIQLTNGCLTLRALVWLLLAPNCECSKRKSATSIVRLRHGTDPVRRAGGSTRYPELVRCSPLLWSGVLSSRTVSDQFEISRPGSGLYRSNALVGARTGSAVSANKVTAILPFERSDRKGSALRSRGERSRCGRHQPTRSQQTEPLAERQPDLCDAKDWLQSAEEKPGSWWPDWDAWMKWHSTGSTSAPVTQSKDMSKRCCRRDRISCLP
jgi:hypothetical protein